MSRPNRGEPSSEALFMTLIEALADQMLLWTKFKKILSVMIIISGLLMVIIIPLFVDSSNIFFLTVMVAVAVIFLGRLCWPAEVFQKTS